jgi:hypothetical protein
LSILTTWESDQVSDAILCVTEAQKRLNCIYD